MNPIFHLFRFSIIIIQKRKKFNDREKEAAIIILATDEHGFAKSCHALANKNYKLQTKEAPYGHIVYACGDELKEAS